LNAEFGLRPIGACAYAPAGMRNVEDENREQSTADRRCEVEKVRK
jgi:hypothetical protein